jgi:hypothetical protein
VSGADRYQEAGMALAEAAQTPSNFDETNPAADRALAEAQVQATLALAAATVLPLVVQHMGDTQAITDWARMIAPDVFEHAPERYEPAFDAHGEAVWLDHLDGIAWLPAGEPGPEGWRRLYVEPVAGGGEPA